MAFIETHDLTKRHRRARGIENVSMTVERGEVFGFLSPTAPARRRRSALCSISSIRRAAATIFGLDRRRDGLAIRARLGNLPGDFAYDPRLTGRELVSLLADVLGSVLCVRAFARSNQAHLAPRRVGCCSYSSKQ